MTVTVSMPQLGESVTEGTVTRWLKKEGERVEADEPLLEVSTDKVDTEIPSPASGILRGITVAEDETVAVGAQLAIIDDAADGGVAATDGQAQAAPAAPQVPQPGGPEPGGYPYAVAEPAPQEYAQPPAAYQAPAEPQYRPAVPGYSAPYGQAPESGYPAAAAETGYAAPPAESYPQPEAYAPPVAPPAAPVPPAPVPPAPAPQAVPVPPPAPEPAAAVPEPAGVPAPPAAPYPAPAEPVAAAPEAPATGPDAQPAAESPYITPLVRKLAAEHGVNLATVAGPRRARAGHRPVHAARHHRAAVPGQAAHRPPDGRVAADLGPAHHRGGGGRHRDHQAAAAGQGRLRGPRGRQAVVPAVLRAGRARGAEGAPQAQRGAEHRRRPDHLPRRRAPRHRGGHRARPDGAGHPQRGRPQHRRPGPQDRRSRGAHQGGAGQPGRTGRRHVHADQHRQPRRPVRHPDHQPAAGGDPRHRDRRQAARGHGGPGPGRGDHGAVHGLPGAHLRPPADRRRRRDPVPGHHQRQAGRGRLRSRTRALTERSRS